MAYGVQHLWRQAEPLPQPGGSAHQPSPEGHPLPRINALVDLYNAISVRHVVPLGGEDADRLEGPLRLTVTAGGEPFDPRGDGLDVEQVAAGEVVWRDDRGVTCRRWNWRQGRRTQLTDDTTRACFVFTREGDGVAVVNGLAGTGKTTALAAACEAWEQSDIPVPTFRYQAPTTTSPALEAAAAQITHLSKKAWLCSGETSFFGISRTGRDVIG